jgi:flagellar basal-body rod modification protein FlgD
MATTNPTPASDPLAALVQATQPRPRASAAESGQDRFLTLLLAQLKNQDPLSPLDNAQLTSQLAQISTVQGIERLNATLTALSGGFAAGQSLQAASLVGRQVIVAGNTLELDDAGASGAFSLPQAVEQLTVTVTDASGTVVHRVDFGARPAGIHVFAWDGLSDAGARAVDGRYLFNVSATAAGKAVSVDALSVGRVDSVSRDGDGVLVNVGSHGSKSLADIKRIL